MGSGPSVPDDIRGHVAKYVPDRAPFLALRAASKFERDAVQRTIARRPGAVRRFGFYPHWADGETLAWEPDEQPTECAASSLAISTLGKVFGEGVIHLSACCRAAPAVAALEFFVKQTNGGLQTLELYRANVAPDRLLELCRACPRLKELRTPVHALIPYGIVEAIAQACPLIEGISVTNNGRDEPLSPAETWARHFPRLKALSFRNGWLEYQPTKLDAIRATALVTNATKMDVDGCHITPEVIEALVGTPFGDRLERLGFSEGTSPTRLEPDALLAAVLGFPCLRALAIPGFLVYGHSFYRALARISNERPAGTGLRNLAIRELDATDECVALACRIEGLEILTLEAIDATRSVVDAILGGAAARSLTSISIRYCAYAPRATALRACDVLRLVQGCPRLNRLSWFCDEEFQEGTLLLWEVCNEITRLLESRGGRVAVQPTRANPVAVGRRVRKKFNGDWYEGRVRFGWYEGVVESVEDGHCEIRWSDGDTTSMEVSDVAKILKQPIEAATRVLVPGDAREPEVLFSCRYDRATERYY